MDLGLLGIRVMHPGIKSPRMPQNTGLCNLGLRRLGNLWVGAKVDRLQS